MINLLTIKNYALIDDLSLDFKDGFTVITGETGSGKSILVEAIELLMGARADTTAIRSGSSICTISGSFTYENPKVTEFLNSLSIPSDDNLVLIRRTIESVGRSKAFINDSPVNISTLANLGELLIDFHNQDEKHTLHSLETQLMILDSKVKDIAPLIEKSSEFHRQISKLKSELDSINLSDAERERKIDLYSFQVQEMEDANLEIGEDEKIEDELPKLKNAEKISSLSEETSTILYSGENTVLSNMLKAKKNIEVINSLGVDAGETLALIDESYYQVEEVYRAIEEILAKTDINPEKLNAALEREELIKKLKKKYGVTIAEILDFKTKLEEELNTLNNFKANTEKLQKDIEEKTQEHLAICASLTEKRKKAASNFADNVKKELFELELKNADFQINFEVKEPTENGQDRIEFMFCANSGEKLLSLRNTASGGEMSRVMLAIELSSEFNKDQTTFFDEIDTGTGGKAGEKIGKKLDKLAQLKQVFSITHLAQVAAFADTHIKIYKEVQDSRTYTKTRILTKEEHIEEIARMISGEQITKSALEHAESLIKISKNK